MLRATCSATEVNRFAVILMVAAAAILLLGIGQRGRFLVPALAAGLVWFKTTHHRVHPRILAVLALLAVVVFSTFIGVFRQPSNKRQLTLKTLTFQTVGGGTELFAPLAGLAETVPRQVAYLDGSSYFETLVFPIPRALWHSKPTGKISGLTHVFDPRDAGLAFPEFGEMYANFGFPGVLIGSILVGVLVELLWLRLAATPSLRTAVLVSVVYAIIAQLFVRGAIAPMLVTFVGLIIATLVLCRRTSLTLAPAAGAPRDHMPAARVPAMG